SYSESIDRLRDVLVRSRFWLSSPLEFNDPFDMSAQLVVEGTVEEKKQRVRALLKERGVKFNDLEKQLRLIMSKPDSDLTELGHQKLRALVGRKAEKRVKSGVEKSALSCR